MSMKAWASSPRRRWTTSISLLPEKMVVIREMRSRVVSGRLIKCFHVGGPLHTRDQ